MASYRYCLFHKPFGVLSQFTPQGTLRALDAYGFPPGVYPVGRLDADSEGLLLLTDDNRVKRRLTDPRFGHQRTYLAQVERIPEAAALERLRRGVVIEGRRTREAEAALLDQEPALAPREVPIRVRKRVPTAWIMLTLREGRNRQVRKMTAAVGHPTLRLVRIGAATLRLGDLPPGSWRELTSSERSALLASLGIAERRQVPGR